MDFFLMSVFALVILYLGIVYVVREIRFMQLKDELEEAREGIKTSLKELDVLEI